MKHIKRNWFYYFLLTICLVMLFLISSCSCNYHLSKVEKKCGSHVQIDTLIVHDTVIMQRILHDTTFKHTNRIDTLTLIKDRLTVKYYYNNRDSTVYLQGECASDTIYKVIKFPYKETVYEFDYIKKYKWYIIIPLLILLIIFGIRIALGK